MLGSFSNSNDSSNLKMAFKLGQFGVNVALVPFEIITIEDFICELSAGILDIGILKNGSNGALMALRCINLLNIKLSLGKNFYF